jgi:hypothetical protein
MEKDGNASFQIRKLINFFPTPYSQEDIEYLFHQFASHLPLIEFEFYSIEV